MKCRKENPSKRKPVRDKVSPPQHEQSPFFEVEIDGNSDAGSDLDDSENGGDERFIAAPVPDVPRQRAAQRNASKPDR